MNELIHISRIFWKDTIRKDIIIEINNIFYVLRDNEKLMVFWEGKDSIEAQQKLIKNRSYCEFPTSLGIFRTKTPILEHERRHIDLMIKGNKSFTYIEEWLLKRDFIIIGDQHIKHNHKAIDNDFGGQMCSVCKVKLCARCLTDDDIDDLWCVVCQ